MTQRLVAFLPFATNIEEPTWKVLRNVSARGYELHPILCDGLFAACDLHLAREPRPANACLVCQANAAGRMAQQKMPYRWLGRWLAPEDTQVAGAWVAGLRPHDYPAAAVNRWTLGEWVSDSVLRHLGGTPDLADPAAATIFASHLFSARLAAGALDRLYRDLRPDAIALAESTSALAKTALGVAAPYAFPVLHLDS